MRVLTTLALLALTVHVAIAGVAIYAPYTHPLPRYWSGTNSRAFMYAHVTYPTKGLTGYVFTIGGEEVDAGEFPPDPAGKKYVYDVPCFFMFDSTHFTPPGRAVEIKLTVWDTDGNMTEDSYTANCWNTAAIWGRYDLEIDPWTFHWSTRPNYDGEWEQGTESWGGCRVVQENLFPIHYNGLALNTARGWTATQFLAGIVPATTVYVNTHGGADDFLWQGISTSQFESDKSDYTLWRDPHAYTPPTQHPEYVIPEHLRGTMQPPPTSENFVIKPTRMSAHGTGLPPFNTGTPPINLAYVDGCECGVGPPEGYDMQFSEAFLYPGGNYYTGYSPLPENQSFCSYLVKTDIDATQAVAQAFWKNLVDGLTVWQARDEAFIAYQKIAEDEPEFAQEWMTIYGDFHTKLHHVYTGASDVPPVTNWFRRINLAGF
jgi:hypothetical protein